MESYEVKKWVTPLDFEYWSGAKSTVGYLTSKELEQIWEYLYDMLDETPSETYINDFFWFETDMIAELLGYESFDEIMERDNEE